MYFTEIILKLITYTKFLYYFYLSTYHLQHQFHHKIKLLNEFKEAVSVE